MPISFHGYDRDTDYARVGQFLVDTYRETGEHINWLQPRWEYMNFHPFIREVDLTTIGVWERDGEIVGVVHPEDAAGGIYFELHPDFGHLRTEMLDHAENRLANRDGNRRRLRIFINDLDTEFQRLALERGYENDARCEQTTRYTIGGQIPEPVVPDGYRVSTVASDGDPVLESRLFWRGFDHGAEPPDDGREDREFMRSSPNFDPELNVLVVAPDGGLVAYCGMWMDNQNKLAYVEPVCTDPDHRRLGLARAAIYEGIRRCAQRGAIAAEVGSTQPLYLSMGFRLRYETSSWERIWSK